MRSQRIRVWFRTSVPITACKRCVCLMASRKRCAALDSLPLRVWLRLHLNRPDFALLYPACFTVIIQLSLPASDSPAGALVKPPLMQIAR